MRCIFTGIARDGNGNIVPSSTITPFLYGTSTAVSIYTTLTGTTAVNSVTAGDDGSFTFYVDRFDYNRDQCFDIQISKTGWTTWKWTNVDIKDVVLGTYAIAADKTVSTNLGLIPEGVIYAPASGKTLTISGKLMAGNYQIFSGTGAVTLSGNTAVIYPEWWGIDGTADDVEIEKALAAGKKVELTAATYSTTGVITIADTYDDRTLFSKVGSNITGSQDVMFETAADRTTVDGVIFTNSHATEQGGTTAFPIYSHDNSYFKFINSKVNGFGTYGVNLDHSHYAIIEYNYIDGGIASDPGGDTGHACINSNASSGIRVQNNYLLKGAQQGVLLGGTGDAYQFNGDSSLIRGRHNYITNNYFVDCWDHPIYASAARYTTIANNTSYNCGSLVTTGTGYTITGNILRSSLSGNGGINIRNGQEVTCTGNIVEVTGAGSGLILGFNNTGLQNMDNIVVKGNTFIGGYAGVYLAESGVATASYNITDIIIEGNQFLDNYGYGVTWYAADAGITDVSRISISNNQFLTADATPPTSAIYARYMQNFKLDNNQINGSYNAGIMVRDALGNGSVCGNKMNLTAANYGLYFKTIADFVTVKNNVIDGTVTTILTTADATDYLYIKGESVTSYFGTTGATDDLEVPIMSVHQPNGIAILGSYITDAANVAQSDTDYNTFTLRDRGTDGDSTNAISTITTKTTGGYAISDFVPLSMGAASTTYRELESGSVLSFVKAHSNGGKVTTAMTVEVRYIEY